MKPCLYCGIDTSNLKFCSSRCAALVNVRARPAADLGKCLQCTAPLKRRRRPYCSLACHQDGLAERRIRRWLATGLPGQHTLTGAVREWIMMEQDGFCAICGLAPTWNGATLVFVLDHIDGDGGNHVRDNVRMICPNCDSQLPTFKARNRGNGRHYRRERYRAGLSY
jgi:hypothetical protein